MTDRVLIYLHVPKCAGQTLSSALRLSFRRSRVLYLDGLDKPLHEVVGSISPEALSQVELVLGHIHYGVHKFLPREPAYVTVLRDPVDRVVSLYKFILREPSHPLHVRVQTSRMSLEDYVSSGIDGSQTENGQTRQISGVQFTDPDSTTLGRAKQNLSTFEVTGLTERFDETFVLLRRKMKLWMPFYISRNVSSTGQAQVSVPDRVLDLIRDRNQLDLELYDFGRAMFSRQMDEQGQAFMREVSRFKKLNRLPNSLGHRAEHFLAKAVRPLLRAAGR